MPGWVRRPAAPDPGALLAWPRNPASGRGRDRHRNSWVRKVLLSRRGCSAGPAPDHDRSAGRGDVGGVRGDGCPHGDADRGTRVARRSPLRVGVLRLHHRQPHRHGRLRLARPHHPVHARPRPAWRAKALAVKGEPAPSNRHDQLYVPRAMTTARALILRHDHRPDHVWSWSRRRRRRQHQACISHYGDEVSTMSAVAVLGVIERLMRLYVVCCVAAVVQVQRMDNSLPPSRSADSAA
jgi:hypothetical protein